MPRSIWSGSISFGLVSVPVKLYPATTSHDVRFTQLHRDTGARVRRKRVDEETGDEVAFDDIVKGYEVGEGRYLVLDPDELDALAPEASRTIDIRAFVSQDEIDPLYYDRPYYLAPATDAAAKPYRLLLDAMRATDRVAVATFVMRTKEHLVALRARDGVLVANTMKHADEVRPAVDLDGLEHVAEVEVRDRELAMAEQLIESLAEPFDIDAYEDEHHARVLAYLEDKAAGNEVTIPTAAEESGEVIDLMAALERSLAAGSRSTAETPTHDLAARSKSELYELAQERDLPGRSGMTKDELVAALGDDRETTAQEAS